MVTAIISGENKKRDGTLRQWDCAEFHGDTQYINGCSVLQVTEQDTIRQINLSTFIGRILLENKELYIFFGELVSYETYDVMINLPF